MKRVIVCMFLALGLVCSAQAQVKKMGEVAKKTGEISKKATENVAPKTEIGKNGVWRRVKVAVLRRVGPKSVKVPLEVQADMTRKINEGLKAGKFTKEDLKAAAKAPILTAGPEGYTFSRVGEAQEITMSELPTLPNGVKVEDIGVVFSEQRGAEIVNKVLDQYVPADYPHADIIKQAYRKGYIKQMRDKGGFWTELDKAAKDARIDSFELTQEALKIRELRAMDNALDLRNYMLDNNLNFPGYVVQNIERATHELWESALKGELPVEIQQMLVEEYLHATNARDITKVLREALQYAQRTGSFPGIKELSMPWSKMREMYDDNGVGRELAVIIRSRPEWRNSVSLGMQTVLITKMLPNTTYFEKVPEETKTTIETISLTMDALAQK